MSTYTERTNSAQDDARQVEGQRAAAAKLADLERPQPVARETSPPHVKGDAISVAIGGQPFAPRPRVPYRSTEKRRSTPKPKTG